MTKQLQIGRLAFRKEGIMWNAYYAHGDTMKGAMLLGSIKMSCIQDYPMRKTEFKMLMQDVVADILEDITGVRPDWGDEQEAPEHERSGNA